MQSRQSQATRVAIPATVSGTRQAFAESGEPEVVAATNGRWKMADGR
jgi:hypothetical protein